MTAAASAVFGSYFGAFGTVGGAAAGSIATTVITRLLQRSIERTQSTVVERVKGVVGLDTGAATGATGAVGSSGTGPAPATGSVARKGQRGASLDRVETVRMDPGDQKSPVRTGRRPARVLVLGTLMIFLLSLALVTGIEWAKGSPLSGGQSGGTSLQRVLEPRAVPPPPVEVAPSEGGSSSEAPSDSADPSASDSPDESDSGGLLPDPNQRGSNGSRPSSQNPPSDNTGGNNGGAATTTSPNGGGLLGGLRGNGSGIIPRNDQNN
jgi:hypothetical protein